MRLRNLLGAACRRAATQVGRQRQPERLIDGEISAEGEQRVLGGLKGSGVFVSCRVTFFPQASTSMVGRGDATWTGGRGVWPFALATMPRPAERHAPPTVATPPVPLRFAVIARAVANAAGSPAGLGPTGRACRRGRDATGSTSAMHPRFRPSSRATDSAPRIAAPSTDDRPHVWGRLGCQYNCHPSMCYAEA